MCKVNDYLEAKKLPNGTLYFDVRGISPDQYLDLLGRDGIGIGCAFGFDEDEVKLLPAPISTPGANDNFRLSRKVDSVSLEAVWLAVALGVDAVKDEVALP